MTDDPKQNNETGQSLIYQIRISGHLSNQWEQRFEGFTITREENGSTLLTGPVIDQAALFGLLKIVRDLGMPLISIDRVKSTISDLGKGETT